MTVQCTKDAHFIVVVARDATLPNIDLESIALLGSGAGCTYVDSNSAFAIFHFPVLACGSVVMVLLLFFKDVKSLIFMIIMISCISMVTVPTGRARCYNL